MKRAFSMVVVVLLLTAASPGISFADEKANEVAAACLSSTGGAPQAFAACVAGGLTAQEIKTCTETPDKCFGPNNEIRKAFCDLGIGNCSTKTYDNYLMQVVKYKNGCIAIFRSGSYLSPDCKDLRGGGNTVNAYTGFGEDYRAIVVYQDTVISAFSGRGIYQSPDGLFLGGGGKTEKRYQGRRSDNTVRSMTVEGGNLKTIFADGSCYLSTDALHPGGGEHTTHC